MPERAQGLAPSAALLQVFAEAHVQGGVERVPLPTDLALGRPLNRPARLHRLAAALQRRLENDQLELVRELQEDHQGILSDLGHEHLL
eukprot:16452356-Heterocapsa_arctica.AAC.1